jgi:hypothetical protein
MSQENVELHRSAVEAFNGRGLDAFLLLSDEKVTVARVRLRGHGTGSDVPFEQPIWQVARWRERRCLWWHSYRSEADALNDAMPPE